MLGVMRLQLSTRPCKQHHPYTKDFSAKAALEGNKSNPPELGYVYSTWCASARLTWPWLHTRVIHGSPTHPERQMVTH